MMSLAWLPTRVSLPGPPYILTPMAGRPLDGRSANRSTASMKSSPEYAYGWPPDRVRTFGLPGGFSVGVAPSATPLATDGSAAYQVPSCVVSPKTTSFEDGPPPLVMTM